MMRQAESSVESEQDYAMRMMSLPTDIAYKQEAVEYQRHLRGRPRTHEYEELIDGIPHKVSVNLDTGERAVLGQTGVPAEPKAPTRLRVWDKEKRRYLWKGWNPTTQEFDISLGVAGEKETETEKKMALGEAIRLATRLTESKLEPFSFMNEEEYEKRYPKLFYKHLSAFIPEEEIPEVLRPSKNFFQKLAGFLSSQDVPPQTNEADLVANINNYETVEELREALAASGGKMSPMREEGKEVWILPSGKKVRF